MSTEQVNESDFIASFLADDHSDAPAEPAVNAEPDSTDSTNETDDTDDADDSGAESPAEDQPEADEVESDDPPSKFNSKALNKAIEAEDPKAFLEALGKHADTLLGAKAHKALRLQAKELKKHEERADKVLAQLNAKFGDPVTARKAAEAGDADTFVEAIERQFGAGWTDIIKFVNDSMAGKPARLQAKAKQAQAQQTAQAEAQAKVKSAIEQTIKTSDQKLLDAHPKIVELVFEKMRAEYAHGVNTPAKALAAVKKELEAQHKALSKIFTGKTETRPASKPRPPREERQSEGRPMSNDDYIHEFLREHGHDNRFRKGRR